MFVDSKMLAYKFIRLIYTPFSLHRAPRPADEVSGAQGKLIRLVEDQLSQGEIPLDIEKLRNQFSIADRLHRDSLSHGEVRNGFIVDLKELWLTNNRAIGYAENSSVQCRFFVRSQ